MGARLVGPAYPVLVEPGDNLALHWALVKAKPGDVIVVDAEDTDHRYWGEVMAVQAISAGPAGPAGLVIAGGVRETDQQRRLGFPIFSSSITVRGTVKRSAGSLGEPITLGGIEVHRGDIIVGDADGVACVPADVLGEAWGERASGRACRT